MWASGKVVFLLESCVTMITDGDDDDDDDDDDFDDNSDENMR